MKAVTNTLNNPRRPAKISRPRLPRLLKFCLPLPAILLVTFSAVPAEAAVESLVARCSKGLYHQYGYEDLLDSYALKLLDKPDGLYEDFAVKTPVALFDTKQGYIDYADVLDRYALAVVNGHKFNLNSYTESGKAKKAEMPAEIMLVSISSGRLASVAATLKQETEEKVPVQTINVSGPKGDPAYAPGGPADQEPQPEKPVTATPIVSSPTVTLSRAQLWAKSKGAHKRFIDIAPHYWEYGRLTGIRPEVMYAQSAYETGFGRFTGIVSPEFNNWAGIKTAAATGDRPEDHEQFATPEDGVRAHFNHMSAYVGLSPVGEPHGRYFTVARLSWAGTVKTVEELSGKWAPSPAYHERIVKMIEEMMK